MVLFVVLAVKYYIYCFIHDHQRTRGDGPVPSVREASEHGPGHWEAQSSDSHRHHPYHAHPPYEGHHPPPPHGYHSYNYRQHSSGRYDRRQWDWPGRNAPPPNRKGVSSDQGYVGGEEEIPHVYKRRQKSPIPPRERTASEEGLLEDIEADVEEVIEQSPSKPTHPRQQLRIMMRESIEEPSQDKEKEVPVASAPKVKQPQGWSVTAKPPVRTQSPADEKEPHTKLQSTDLVSGKVESPTPTDQVKGPWDTSGRGPVTVPRTLYEPEGHASAKKFSVYKRIHDNETSGEKRVVTTPVEHPGTPDTPPAVTPGADGKLAILKGDRSGQTESIPPSSSRQHHPESSAKQHHPESSAKQQHPESSAKQRQQRPSGEYYEGHGRNRHSSRGGRGGHVRPIYSDSSAVHVGEDEREGNRAEQNEERGDTKGRRDPLNTRYPTSPKACEGKGGIEKGRDGKKDDDRFHDGRRTQGRGHDRRRQPDRNFDRKQSQDKAQEGKREFDGSKGRESGPDIRRDHKKAYDGRKDFDQNHDGKGNRDQGYDGDEDGRWHRDGRKDQGGRRNRDGAYDGRRNRDGAHDGRRNRDGAHDGRRNRDGAHDGRRNRDGAHDGRRNRDGAHDGRRNRDGAYSQEDDQKDYDGGKRVVEPKHVGVSSKDNAEKVPHLNEPGESQSVQRSVESVSEIERDLEDSLDIVDGGRSSGQTGHHRTRGGHQRPVLTKGSEQPQVEHRSDRKHSQGGQQHQRPHRDQYGSESAQGRRAGGRAPFHDAVNSKKPAGGQERSLPHREVSKHPLRDSQQNTSREGMGTGSDSSKGRGNDDRRGKDNIRRDDVFIGDSKNTGRQNRYPNSTNPYPSDSTNRQHNPPDSTSRRSHPSDSTNRQDYPSDFTSRQVQPSDTHGRQAHPTEPTYRRGSPSDVSTDTVERREHKKERPVRPLQAVDTKPKTSSVKVVPPRFSSNQPSEKMEHEEPPAALDSAVTIKGPDVSKFDLHSHSVYIIDEDMPADGSELLSPVDETEFTEVKSKRDKREKKERVVEQQKLQSDTQKGGGGGGGKRLPQTPFVKVTPKPQPTQPSGRPKGKGKPTVGSSASGRKSPVGKKSGSDGSQVKSVSHDKPAPDPPILSHPPSPTAGSVSTGTEIWMTSAPSPGVIGSGMVSPPILNPPEPLKPSLSGKQAEEGSYSPFFSGPVSVLQDFMSNPMVRTPEGTLSPESQVTPAHTSLFGKAVQGISHQSAGMRQSKSSHSPLHLQGTIPTQELIGQQPHAAQHPSQPHTAQHLSQPHTAQHPSQPHTVQHPSQPHTAQHPSQPHAAQHPSQPHAAQHPSQPHAAQHPSQPHTSQYPSQPHTAHHPSQPHTAHHPSQPHMSHHSPLAQGPHRTQYTHPVQHAHHELIGPKPEEETLQEPSPVSNETSQTTVQPSTSKPTMPTHHQQQPIGVTSPPTSSTVPTSHTGQMTSQRHDSVGRKERSDQSAKRTHSASTGTRAQQGRDSRPDKQQTNAPKVDGQQQEQKVERQQSNQRQDRRHGDRNARGPADRNARGPADRNVRGLSDRNAQGPADRNTQEPADRNARGPADRNARGPADRNARGPADRNTQEPADRNARGPADRNAQGPADRNARGPADRNARAPADRKTERQKQDGDRRSKTGDMRESKPTHGRIAGGRGAHQTSRGRGHIHAGHEGQQQDSWRKQEHTSSRGRVSVCVCVCVCVCVWLTV